MAKEIKLDAVRRDVTGKQVKKLRLTGKLPAVIYGHGVDPVSIALDAHDASLKLMGLSASAIVTIALEGKEHATLVREKQRDYVKNRLLHVDFQVVSLTEKISTQVRVDLSGESPAVREFNAVIVQNLNQVSVEALPGDLPERLIVDISKLTEVGSAFYVRDLEISDQVTLLTDPDEVVVVATGQAAEEVEEVVEVEEGAEPEVIERGKKEDEEDEE